MLNVLVIGTGNYVCGRGSAGFGTILPALIEAKRCGLTIGTVTVAGTRPRGIAELKAKLGELERLTQVRLDVRGLPEGDKEEPLAYRRVLAVDTKPTCAIVVVPDALHGQVTADVLEAGCHALVVKPLTPTVPEAMKLLALQRRQGVYGAVEFHKRWDRSNLLLRQRLRSGVLGDPQYFLIEYSQRKDIPSEQFRTWAETTNSFQYLGVHYVDIVSFTTGARPVRVSATGQWGWLKQQGINAYDAVQATVEWRTPSGHLFTSVFLTNWIDPRATSALSDQRIKVIGTKGRFESDQKRRGIQIVSDEGGIEEPNPDFCVPYTLPGSSAVEFRGYGIESVMTFLQDVAAMTRGDITPASLEGERPTFRDALLSTAVIEAANTSLAKCGEWIAIEIPVLA